MNMQQRRYLLKERLKPLEIEAARATRDNALRFKPYVSWGNLVRMIKSGELKLKREAWYKSLGGGYVSASYDNPFGEEAGERLSASGGIKVDPEAQALDQAEWKQRFKHSTDFIMLASEDTIIALLHNLEKSVKEYVERAKLTKKKAHADQAKYIKWLEDQGATHSYQEVK